MATLTLVEARELKVQRDGKTLQHTPPELVEGDRLTTSKPGRAGLLVSPTALLVLEPGARLVFTPSGLTLDSGLVYLDTDADALTTKVGVIMVRGEVMVRARGDKLAMLVLSGSATLSQGDLRVLVNAGEWVRADAHRVHPPQLADQPTAAPSWLVELYARLDRPLPAAFPSPVVRTGGGGGRLASPGSPVDPDDAKGDDDNSGRGRGGSADDSSGRGGSTNDSSGRGGHGGSHD